MTNDLTDLPELPVGFHWKVYPKLFTLENYYGKIRLDAVVVAVCRDVPKRTGWFTTEKAVVEEYMVKKSYNKVSTAETTPENILYYAHRALGTFDKVMTLEAEQQRKEAAAKKEAEARKQLTGRYPAQKQLTAKAGKERE